MTCNLSLKMSLPSDSNQSKTTDNLILECLERAWIHDDKKFAAAKPITHFLEQAKKLPASEKYHLDNESSEPIFLLWKLADGEIRQANAYDWEASLFSSRLRNTCVCISWSIPTHATIMTILDRSKNILDMGCGSGYWSYMFKQAGAESVIAIDNDSDQAKIVKIGTFYPVTKKDCVSWMKAHSGNYDSHAMFFSWPRTNKIMVDCIEVWKGQHIFVIGEDSGGCTGCLDTYMKNNESWKSEKIEIPTWNGINDSLTIYTRISANSQ